MHSFDGDPVRAPLTVVARTVGVAVVLLLVPACTPERETPAAERAVSTPPTNASGGEAAFLKFLEDPANTKSWRWLCSAAAEGHTAAQFTVGVRYRDGLPPVTQNLPRAFLWFKAAETGGLTAAVLAREAVQKQLPDDAVEALRKRSGPLTEADCREGKVSSKKNPAQ